MYLIIGLGNPGRKYANTRHNLGFRAIDLLSEKHNIHLRKHLKPYESGSAEIAGEKVVLVKPLTYMNLSGEIVSSLVKKKSIHLEKILVICDDINLPLGDIRFRAKGSAGGHNGLSSIIEHLGSSDFPRLRIGIGPAIGPWEKFVLQNFSLQEEETIQNSLKKILEIVEAFIQT